jgi:hypothetical protein
MSSRLKELAEIFASSFVCSFLLFPIPVITPFTVSLYVPLVLTILAGFFSVYFVNKGKVEYRFQRGLYVVLLRELLGVCSHIM